MISVVLPTYNGQQYLSKAIESIIAQTYTDWELIIIDDCSKDNSSEIVMEYVNKDSRIKYFRNEKNLKLPASLNRGFSLSKGEYLTWTSDDNLFMPNAFEKMANYLDSNSDTGLVFSRQEIIDENDQSIKLLDIVTNIDDLYFKDIIEACFMYTREVYEKVGDYDVNKFLAEDWDYWLRIYRDFKIGYIEEVLYQYRVHSGSLTQTKNTAAQKAAIELFEETLKANDRLTDYVKENIYYSIIQKSFSINNFELMKQYINRIEKEYPKFKIGKKYTIARYVPERLLKTLKTWFHSIKYGSN